MALIHDGPLLAPHNIWTGWSFEPAVMATLALTGGLYLRGVAGLWRSAGAGHGVRRGEAASFAAGWIVLLAALVSPLHRLGSTLFSAHMVQHELLMVVAAPLLVLGRPLIPFVWALPVHWRKRVGSWSTSGPVRRIWLVLSLPLVAWILHAAAIWLWHAPVLFQAAAVSEAVHAAQHVCFLATALLFWWTLLGAGEGRPARVAGVVYLFTTAVHTNILGALLAFSGRLWYPIYQSSTAPWGLTPLEDQQLAGLIMWVPAGLAYLIAALVMATSWLRDAEQPPLLQVR